MTGFSRRDAIRDVITFETAPGADDLVREVVEVKNTVSVTTRTAVSRVSPVVTAGAAYAAGNVVGGVLTFPGCVDAAGSGLLQSARLVAKSIRTEGYRLAIFKSAPSAGFVDRVAPAITAPDIAALIAIVDLTPAAPALGAATIYRADGLAMPVVIAGGSTLYGVLLTTGAVTYGSTTDVVEVSLGILKD